MHKLLLIPAIAIVLASTGYVATVHSSPRPAAYCSPHPSHPAHSSHGKWDRHHKADRHPKAGRHYRKCHAPTSPSTSQAPSTPTTVTTVPEPTTTSPAPESDPPPSSSAPTTATPTPTPTQTTSAPAASVECTNPRFVTTSTNGMWNDGGYVVHNNMWNVSNYRVSETLSACAYNNWYVTATADNSSGDGAVKTYPNVHKDYHDWGSGSEPSLSSFDTLKSSFAATSPHVGIYNVAYDIWLNGVPGNREIMIWTDNYRQTPAGSVVARDLSFSGHSWDVYATGSNGYIAFVPAQPITQGTLDLKAMLDYLRTQGRIPANSTLGQICFGVEVVSTDGKPATFKVTDFSVTDG